MMRQICSESRSKVSEVTSIVARHNDHCVFPQAELAKLKGAGAAAPESSFGFLLKIAPKYNLTETQIDDIHAAILKAVENWKHGYFAGGTLTTKLEDAGLDNATASKMHVEIHSFVLSHGAPETKPFTGATGPLLDKWSNKLELGHAEQDEALGELIEAGVQSYGTVPLADWQIKVGQTAADLEITDSLGTYLINPSWFQLARMWLTKHQSRL